MSGAGVGHRVGLESVPERRERHGEEAVPKAASPQTRQGSLAVALTYPGQAGVAEAREIGQVAASNDHRAILPGGPCSQNTGLPLLATLCACALEMSPRDIS